MRIKIIKKEFVLTLEDNARTSLKHGIYHYLRYIKRKSNRNDLKFAIVHIFHAIELYLKARLVQESPLLIYSNPENPINDDSHTVQFKALLGRLGNAGVDFKQHRPVLENLQRIRNRIEHHKVKSTVSEIKDYLAKAAKFLDIFLAAELRIELKDVLKGGDYLILKDLIYSYEERLAKAKSEIGEIVGCGKEALDATIYVCPDCYTETVLFGDNGKPHCYFCGEDLLHAKCLRCGEPLFGVPEDGFCEVCSEYILNQ